MNEILTITAMTEKDWPAVAAIYAAGIATGIATFENTVPDWSTFDGKTHPCCRLVARSDKEVVGWATLQPVSSRACYSGVAEVSIYVDPKAQGKGVGLTLLKELTACSESQGFWTLQSQIFATNEASQRLHQAAGFRQVGRREKLAKKNGLWQDTFLYERRSPKILG